MKYEWTREPFTGERKTSRRNRPQAPDKVCAWLEDYEELKHCVSDFCNEPRAPGSDMCATCQVEEREYIMRCVEVALREADQLGDGYLVPSTIDRQDWYYHWSNVR